MISINIIHNTKRKVLYLAICIIAISTFPIVIFHNKEEKLTLNYFVPELNKEYEFRGTPIGNDKEATNGNTFKIYESWAKKDGLYIRTIRRPTADPIEIWSYKNPIISKEKYKVENDGIVFLENHENSNIKDLAVEKIVEGTDFKFRFVNPNTEWTSVYKDIIKKDLSMDLNLSVKYKFEKYEKLTVMGEKRLAAKISSSEEIKYTNQISGQKEDSVIVIVYWYVKGLGLVKEKDENSIYELVNIK